MSHDKLIIFPSCADLCTSSVCAAREIELFGYDSEAASSESEMALSGSIRVTEPVIPNHCKFRFRAQTMHDLEVDSDFLFIFY